MHYNVIKFVKKGDNWMTPGLQKMWISFVGMGFMFISLFFIYISRYKLTGIWKGLTGIVAYILLLLAGFIIFVVVVSGPTTG